MRKIVVIVLALALVAGVFLYNRAVATSDPDAPSAGPGARGGGGPGSGRGSGGPGGFGRPPMTVDTTSVARSSVSDRLTVVGNLVGAATVEVAPRVAGRVEAVSVRIGDRVSRGQLIAKVEDREIREQVKQAEAAFEVAKATVRQREADQAFAETNLTRSQNLFDRQLLAQQALDDAQARAQAATAQLDLSRAQFAQSQSRLDELRITLANTRIVSPVDGFVGKRYLDPGGYVSPSTPVASLVDIHLVRLQANLVEKDLGRVAVGVGAVVEVDAFPGDKFTGRVARVAPVLDPSTRTAQMEIEVPNADFRLKPGMYARVGLLLDVRESALVVPRNAVVDLGGQRGVFVPDGRQARFVPVTTGWQDADRVEILDGIEEGLEIITTGAAGLEDGDPIARLGGSPGGQPGDEPRGRAGSPGGGDRQPAAEPRQRPRAPGGVSSPGGRPGRPEGGRTEGRPMDSSSGSPRRPPS